MCIVDDVLQYTKSSIPSIVESKTDELAEQYEGCNCETESCSPTGGCSCIDRFGPAYNSDGCLSDIAPYSDQSTPVIECNDDCSCERSCFNRVVQHGVTLSLQVYDVGHKGVGVRTLQPIRRGRFVCEYSGELVSRGSAARRAAYADRTVHHNYLLTVREFFGTAKLLTTYVDATYVGNVGRLINHSCDPNLFVQPVRVDNAVPKVALFALTDIPADTELAYDYGGGEDCRTESGGDYAADEIQRRKPCLCGSPRCRLVLPRDNSPFVL